MRWLNLLLRKSNPANRAIVKTVTPGQPVWTKKDYALLAEAGYQNVATVFACVKIIASTASRVPWLLDDGRGNEIERHPLLDLLARPNDRDSGIVFTEKVLSFELLAGNSYIYMARSGLTKLDGGAYPPRYLYSLRPDRMKAVASSDWRQPIAFWEYTAASQKVPFKIEDIVHLLEFHPTNDWYGLSRLEVAARDVDISNQAKAWNKSILQNFMTPAGLFNFKNGLQEEQREDFRKEVEQSSAGTDNAGKFIITEGEATWTQMSMVPKDLDWQNGQKQTMRQICAIFGVPSMLLGDTEATTYNNYQEARKALYEETVLPLLDIYVCELNARLVKLFGEGLTLSYDRDSIEALQEERSTKYAYLATANWLSINEKRQACGYDDIVEGDVVMVSMADVPLAQAVAPPAPVPAALDPFAGEGDDGKPPKDEGGEEDDETEPRAGTPKKTRGVPAVKFIRAIKKSYWTEDGRRHKLWAAFDQRARAAEKSFVSEATRYQMRQADEIRARVKTYPSVNSISATDLLNVKDETKRYAQEFKTWYVDHAMRAGRAGVAATKGEVYEETKAKPPRWSFDLKPGQEEQLKSMVYDSGTKVNKSTIDIIYRTLSAAQQDNATIDQFAQQIWEQVDKFSPNRARLWAETESTKVDNWAMLEGYKQGGAELKGWNCQMLDTSREDHVVADGEEVPLDEPFIKTGEPMMYPGDPAGSAGNVCRCRCSQYPVTRAGGGEAPEIPPPPKPAPPTEPEPAPAQEPTPLPDKTPEWKPQMTEAEADAWAKDSVIQETLNHNTGARSVEGILQEGFQIGSGQMYGKGIYMSDTPVIEYGPVNFKLRINVRNPYNYHDGMFHEANDWWATTQYEARGPVSMGQMITEYLQGKGFDSIKIPNRMDGTQTWFCVFDPKSVVIVGRGR